MFTNTYIVGFRRFWTKTHVLHVLWITQLGASRTTRNRRSSGVHLIKNYDVSEYRDEPRQEVVPASGKRGEIATKAQPVDIKRIKVEEPQVNIGTADPVADFARAKEIDPQASRKELAAVVQRLFSEPTGHMYGKAAKALAVLRDENCEEFATLLPVLAALGPAVPSCSSSSRTPMIKNKQIGFFMFHRFSGEENMCGHSDNKACNCIYDANLY